MNSTLPEIEFRTNPRSERIPRELFLNCLNGRCYDIHLDESSAMKAAVAGSYLVRFVEDVNFQIKQ